MEAPATGVIFVALLNQTKLYMYMQSPIISSSRRQYIVPAILLGTAFFLMSSYQAHAMTSADHFAQMEGQLKTASEQISQLQAARHMGSVLGVSTTTAEAPVRPVCRVSLDKQSYVLGDTIKFSWKTTGAVKVELVPDTSGKDTLVLPQADFKVSEGSASIRASVLGNPLVTFKVTSKTGHYMTCSRVVPIVAADASKKDTRLAPMNAQIIKMSNEVAKLLSNRETIDQKISSLQTKIDELQAKINQIVAGGSGSGSTTPRTNSVFTLTSSEETVLINNVATTSDDLGQFTLKFDATAAGDDITVPAKAAQVGSTTEGVLYQVIDAATGKPAKKGTYTASLFSSADRTGTMYVVNEGETESFTVTVMFDPTVTGMYKVQLVSLVTSTSGPKFAFKPAADFSSDALMITN